MLKINFVVLLLSALIPLVMGFIWYNPKIFGKAWMQASGLTEESMKGANMALIFGLTYLFSFLAAGAIQFMVIHQFHLFSILINEPGINEKGSEVNMLYTSCMEKYGTNFRTFKHGALHGTIGGILLATPIISINALFERKGFKYIAINAGFWTVCMSLMGGIICAYS